MNPTQRNDEDSKTKIVAQIAELSGLLGMLPSDDTIEMTAPIIEKKMVLSDWFSAARQSFLKLSLMISQELDIQLQ